MNRSPPPLAAHPALPAEVRAPFLEAHEACALTPGYALVQARATLCGLVDAWLRHLAKGTAGSLSEKADRLVRLERLSTDEAALIDQIRIAGNLGAHPEQRKGPPPSRADARAVLEQLSHLVRLFLARTTATSIEELPTFAEPPESSWGEICESAIFHREPTAMLAVGRRLAQQGRARLEHADADLAARDDLLHALTWFEAAIAGSTEPSLQARARHELGRVLLLELALPDRQDEALAALEDAARTGNSDAQALLAVLILDPRSPLPTPRDLAQGRTWAELAAEAEHPEALNLLTAIYGNGDGVERDRARALVHARRASRAGYPLAHANLALLLLEGEPDPARDQEIRGLVDRALAAGVPEATWARHLLLLREGPDRWEEAEQALHHAAALGVPGALLALCEREMRGPAEGWDLAPLVERLIRAVQATDLGRDQARGRALLFAARDEADRRVRLPGGPPHGPRGDALFALVIHAGANLDIKPAEDPHERARRVMSALGRVVAPLGAPATAEDVALILRAVPSFPVRWQHGRAELISPPMEGSGSVGGRR